MNIPCTIPEQVEARDKLSITHRSLNSSAYIHDQKTDSWLQIPFNPLYNKYREYFDQYIDEVKLNTEQQKKYKYSPKKMSLDIYNTTEYWSLILYINECPSILDFNLEKVKLVYNDKIKEFINELIILNE